MFIVGVVTKEKTFKCRGLIGKGRKREKVKRSSKWKQSFVNKKEKLVDRRVGEWKERKIKIYHVEVQIPYHYYVYIKPIQLTFKNVSPEFHVL